MVWMAVSTFSPVLADVSIWSDIPRLTDNVCASSIETFLCGSKSVLFPINIFVAQSRCVPSALVVPLCYPFKWISVRYIIDHDHSIGSSIIRRWEGPEPFCSRGVPYLQFYSPFVDGNSFDHEINSNRIIIWFLKLVIFVSWHQTRFADTGISDEYQLYQIIIFRRWMSLREMKTQFVEEFITRFSFHIVLNCKCWIIHKYVHYLFDNINRKWLIIRTKPIESWW